MPTLKKFLSSVEPKLSPIHGTGIFTKKAIKRGEYCSQGSQDIVNYVQQMNAANSPLAPAWRDLLFGDGDGGGEEIPLGERLARLRSDFASFAEEERSRANIVDSVSLTDGTPSELRVRVGGDMKRGAELLRAYGPEWLSIKYFHLKANLIMYRTRLEDGGRRFMVFVDPRELFLQDMTVWEDNERGLGPAEAAKLLSEKSGKDVRHISLEEMNSMASVLGMLAHEHFGKGNWKFDSSWKSTQAQLKERADAAQTT